MNSAFITAFNAIRTQLVLLIETCLGSLLSPQISLIADVILWFCWLWIIFHIIFKPFISIFSWIISPLKNKFFDELEVGE